MPHITFMCKEEAAVAEREGARLRRRQQQHRTTGLRDREAVAVAVGQRPLKSATAHTANWEPGGSTTYTTLRHEHALLTDGYTNSLKT
ncbi:hypothetical protein DBV15_04775 [Temnothorax longispinosus]|uniref:Uncharacterized protein n=1 Tax=Temnothorax longispinosus TaxID=300112 RepID=A0A4S2JQP6_9HYME|nr:hypothetical protein DBV15_04775 [Temnothorax longispinosus]